MEKKKAHHDLGSLQRFMKADQWMITVTAERNAWEDFEIDRNGIKSVILHLDKRDFYKSMTTLNDHTRWQDVYTPSLQGISAYIKLQEENSKTVIIQFKRK